MPIESANAQACELQLFDDVQFPTKAHRVIATRTCARLLASGSISRSGRTAGRVERTFEVLVRRSMLSPSSDPGVGSLDLEGTNGKRRKKSNTRTESTVLASGTRKWTSGEKSKVLEYIQKFGGTGPQKDYASVRDALVRDFPNVFGVGSVKEITRQQVRNIALANIKLGMLTLDEGRSLVCDLCRTFYEQGWCSGTGGGVSIKVDERIIMAPSGVQKERMLPEDMFVLDADGIILEEGVHRLPEMPRPKLSECAPLFMEAYKQRNAGAVLHSHALEAMLVTLIDESAATFTVTHLEMIKGIRGHGYHDVLTVPIIDNTARECELTASLAEAIHDYPDTYAVLVRRHGVYIWGDSWAHAKTQAECYHYLFKAALEMRKMGIDPAVSTSNGRTNAVILDIEGTIAPVSFVADVLFPYAMREVRRHLQDTWHQPETRSCLAELQGYLDADGYTAPQPSSTEEQMLDFVSSALIDMMAKDKKYTPLKRLQGAIWRSGYQKKELVADVFDDLVLSLQRWTSRGIKVYIYSSGSREAQGLLFGHTQYGDLRRYISGYFDTMVGPKNDSNSYQEIALSIGESDTSKILFATDVFAEAEAASRAGIRAVLVLRPGNKPLPSVHEFLTVHDTSEFDALL